MAPARELTRRDEQRGDALEILLALGHRRAEAESKVDNVIEQHPEMLSPEEIIREVYRRERG